LVLRGELKYVPAAILVRLARGYLTELVRTVTVGAGAAIGHDKG
jgi:hypothetical protein